MRFFWHVLALVSGSRAVMHPSKTRNGVVEIFTKAKEDSGKVLCNAVVIEV